MFAYEPRHDWETVDEINAGNYRIPRVLLSIVINKPTRVPAIVPFRTITLTANKIVSEKV